ncbi:hypothetical protein AKJ45_02575 [candidate division MSBL1 archaeon SCGC-AAA261F19]|uniref:Uncharacterized protein n=1 Tax=candidate division MSBL1 archaeon SCGC-AAA261F19 TaxID=1698275 RepID=A0A133V9K8_9EURY|nr:hypothetical protein AKJ45_02575 [candidate division MSBL1 archaeon SCGC-AAA261F19]
MDNEVKAQLTPFERFILDVIEDRFQELAEKCEYRFSDFRGLINCRWQDSSVGCCRIELCPRLNERGGETNEAGGN